MGLLRLNRINRLFLLGWTVGAVAVAVGAPETVPVNAVPTPGPLDSLSERQRRYGVLGLLWLAGTVATLGWQRTLWTTMGSGAGLGADGGLNPFRLPPLRGSVRGRTVTAEAVRRGWSPLAGLRTEAAVDATDPAAALELAITTESDPEGRVLFEAPDADRRYVLRDGSGDLEAVLPTDFRAELVDVETPGILRVDGSHASFQIPYLPFDAARLDTCAETTVRLAEQVERASGPKRAR